MTQIYDEIVKKHVRHTSDIEVFTKSYRRTIPESRLREKGMIAIEQATRGMARVDLWAESMPWIGGAVEDSDHAQYGAGCSPSIVGEQEAAAAQRQSAAADNRRVAQIGTENCLERGNEGAPRGRERFKDLDEMGERDGFRPRESPEVKIGISVPPVGSKIGLWFDEM